MRKALFLLFLRCLLITDLFDNLESGKKIIVSEKSLEKVLNLFLVSVQSINGSEKKKDQLGSLESKAGTVKRPEKNCYQACPIGSLENFYANAGV